MEYPMKLRTSRYSKEMSLRITLAPLINQNFKDLWRLMILMVHIGFI